MNKTLSLIKGVLIFALILGLQFCSRAASYVITSSDDGTNVYTLRGAIAAAARNHSRNDTIHLVRGNYQLTAQVYNDELPVAVGRLTIVGEGRSGVTISSAYLERVFHVLPGAKLTLKNLTITGGGDYHYDNSVGGAIFNEGTLKLVNCNIQGNSSYYGAGIYNSGNLTMNNSIVANNSCFTEMYYFESEGGGGGIYNTGSLSANNCVISNNVSGAGQEGNYFFGDGLTITGVGPFPSVRGGDAGNGGGIYNSGTMILNNCFIMDNSTGGGGNGAMGNAIGANGGAGGNGGGVYNCGRLMLRHCIISANSCGNGGAGADGGRDFINPIGYDGGNGGLGGYGGGVFNTNGFIVASYNSLIALNQYGRGGGGGAGYPGSPGFVTSGEDGNIGSDGLGPDLFGNFTSTGHNLVRESDDSTGFTNGVSHDITGTIAAPANLQLYKSK